jgi:hypothetical protein
VLGGALLGKPNQPLNNAPLEGEALTAVRLDLGTEVFWMVGTSLENPLAHSIVLKGKVEQSDLWNKLWCADEVMQTHILTGLMKLDPDRTNPYALKDNNGDLAIYARPDGSSLSVGPLPQATLNDALALFTKLPAFHISSYDHVSEFWKFLIYQIKKRENDEKEFMQRPKIRALTVAEAEDEFNQANPNILIWPFETVEYDP